jgi:hypothetical protein
MELNGTRATAPPPTQPEQEQLGFGNLTDLGSAIGIWIIFTAIVKLKHENWKLGVKRNRELL